MRTVTYGGACSLDGFIMGPNDAIDWLIYSPAVAEIIGEFWKRVDTFVMGRKTWDFARQQWGQAGAGDTSGMRTYVFSRTLTSIEHPGVTLVREDAAGFVRGLKTGKGKGICVFGGGDFARTLLEADLIDEIGFNVHPVLLGSGVPGFLDAGRRVDLKLEECRQLPKECVYVRYSVKHRRRA
jgi:dihydrofolate reductase